jgi:pimeloyl-ACP methyl ester carboxylesterase
MGAKAVLAALAVGLAGLIVAGAVAPAAPSVHEASAAAPKSCPKGSVAARIAGKRVCLKAGQRCKRTLDRQYHRYGFHCHTGRLTRTKPKPPEVFSRKVDVGGFRLAISCRGTGSPIVVLESAENASAQAWYLLDRTVAKTTRVCSYDRAGLGLSDARRPPGPVPAANVVEELHRLLAGAGISPPYVLGGWSLGGFFNRLYTKRYPADVLGLVGVEGMPIGLPGEPWWGFLDLIGGPGSSDSYYLAAARAELAAAPDLGSRPLVLLTHGIGPRGATPEDEALWLKLQKQVALLSTSSILVRADNAGYAIQTEALDLTAEAFRQVIAAARARGPLPACSTTPLTSLGGTCLDPTSPSEARSERGGLIVETRVVEKNPGSRSRGAR